MTDFDVDADVERLAAALGIPDEARDEWEKNYRAQIARRQDEGRRRAFRTPEGTVVVATGSAAIDGEMLDWTEAQIEDFDHKGIDPDDPEGSAKVNAKNLEAYEKAKADARKRAAEANPTPEPEPEPETKPEPEEETQPELDLDGAEDDTTEEEATTRKAPTRR